MGIETVEVGQILQTADGECVVLTPSKEYSHPGNYTAGLIEQLDPLVIKHIHNSASIAEIEEIIGTVEIPDIIKAIELGVQEKLVNSKTAEICTAYLHSLQK